MTTVKELKNFLNNFNDNEKIYIAVDKDLKNNCILMNENQIIENANNIGGVSEPDEELKNIKDALIYLYEMDTERYYLDIEV